MHRLRLNRHLLGMRWNCSPNSPKVLTRGQFIGQIAQARQMVSSSHRTLFCPRPAFTNRAVWIGEDDDVYSRKMMNPVYGPVPEDYDPATHGYCDPHPVIGQEESVEVVMTRTKQPADGGIVRGTGNAVAFFNGDCPIIALVEDDKLAVLHAGFRTLVRENKGEPNIIEVAIKHFNPDNTRAFVGFGIGPCCWAPEYEDKPEVIDPSLSRHPELLASCIGKTTYASPFGSGHVSVDLYGLAKGLLMKVGIPENKILLNDRCTCCAWEDGKPLFWSHTRFKAGKQAINGRNMAVAWLDKELQSDGFETL